MVVLLVIAGAYEAQAACNIYSLSSCLAYTKAAQTPSRPCCNAIAALGGGQAGANCLCSLMTSAIARQYGVNQQVAVGMPHRCGLAVPYHSVCNGE
jgi:hypothetical protein